MPSPRIYDVSLSFAGEDRKYVEAVAEALRAADVSVFYDAYEEVELWGRDLYQHLFQVYSTSRYCVIFVSAAYERRVWTRHELRSAQARALTEQREYILPARFDSTEIPGLPATIAYVDLTTKSPSEFAQLVIRKVRNAQVDDVSPAATHTIEATRGPAFDRKGWRVAAIALLFGLLIFLFSLDQSSQTWSDQDNCGLEERWVGMRPHRAEWSGMVALGEAERAVFHGEFRWAPEVNQVKRTTAGRVELEVDGKVNVIYHWNSPPKSTYSFSVNVGRFLVGTSGRFKIHWVWEDGTSGVCIAKSVVTT